MYVVRVQGDNKRKKEATGKEGKETKPSQMDLRLKWPNSLGRTHYPPKKKHLEPWAVEPHVVEFDVGLVSRPIVLQKPFLVIVESLTEPRCMKEGPRKQSPGLACISGPFSFHAHH
jgi:hypothetical protein